MTGRELKAHIQTLTSQLITSLREQWAAIFKRNLARRIDESPVRSTLPGRRLIGSRKAGANNWTRSLRLGILVSTGQTLSSAIFITTLRPGRRGWRHLSDSYMEEI